MLPPLWILQVDFGLTSPIFPMSLDMYSFTRDYYKLYFHNYPLYREICEGRDCIISFLNTQLRQESGTKTHKHIHIHWRRKKVCLIDFTDSLTTCSEPQILNPSYIISFSSHNIHTWYLHLENKEPNWDSLRRGNMHNFTYIVTAEGKVRERKELNLPGGSLSSKGPQPEFSPAWSCIQAQNSPMSYPQTIVICIPFPWEKSPGRTFNLHRNATSWSTSNSSSHPKISSGPGAW